MTAVMLLTLFASGGTIERTVVDLPMFKAHLESALDWIAGGRCSRAEVSERAVRLGEIIRRKHEAIKRQDFDLAAKLRGEECAIFQSFWLETPAGTSHTILNFSVEEQMRQLSAFLYDTKAA
jgi:hypothetical protein